MGHNSVASGYPKSIGILRVDELSTGLSNFRGVTAWYQSIGMRLPRT